MLIADALLYFVLALYGDTFRPERYSAKCWQHCCTSVKVKFFQIRFKADSKQKATLGCGVTSDAHNYSQVHAKDCFGRVKSIVEHLFCGDNADSVASETVPCHDIVFANVTFGFEKRVKVLEDVSIQIVDKKRTAIVGPGGAGKTTFARLISGKMSQPL